MAATVAQMIDILNRLAPPHLAESWDHVGLQIGDRSWPVSKVWTALDPLPDVVAAACANGVDLLVTHHPLFFKPIRSIDCATPQGRIAAMALSGKLAVFSAHTNLDSTVGGVNEVLAGRMGLEDLSVLSASADDDQMRKLVVFTPATHVKAILDTLFDMDAGRMGRYACCTFRCDGIGTFVPEVGASPSVGHIGAMSEVQESRVEILTVRGQVARLVEAIRTVHPYETMAYDVYPLTAPAGRTGLGRVGRLPDAVPLAALARRLKAALALPGVKVVGRADRMVATVAVCSGSGAGLLNAAVAAGAQAYVSGDLGYHTARDAEQAGIGLIDIGHFGSEHPIVEALAAAIRQAVDDAGLAVAVEASDRETDPFAYL